MEALPKDQQLIVTTEYIQNISVEGYTVIGYEFVEGGTIV